ncbi:hypothetical protein C475_10614 [Halosimplex carlsbadense 2-9-1]|uniref:Lipoprotein n=1 Tax=Halosimplex carlsbadense 2-9-1 TaxID=797114 RepID=M0CSV5_9EURY|nr:hypothetical protein [Halosimplex carlsbadense]ELZ25477.1 hypothetical protein C475_10614 [Halosimplex carlsbadense 2-9-1]
MDRRLAVATLLVALAAAAAGCGSYAGSLSMTAVDDAGLAERASYDLGDDDPFETVEARIVRAAVENGSTTRNASREFVRAGRAYRYDGAYYNVSYEVVGTVPGYGGGIRIDYNTTDFGGEAVAYEDLPAVDRRALEPLFAGPREDREEGFDFGFPVAYTQREAGRSVLVPGQRYGAVVYEGETYRIATDGVERDSLRTFRYEATRVADSATAFAADLTDRYAFSLSGLSDAEREVVESATGGSYTAESVDDEGFAGVVERFRAQEAVRDEGGNGDWLVRYDGGLYWAELDYGGFLTDRGPPVTRPSATPPPE